MLSSEKLMAFVSTTNANRARAFYRNTLGLTLVSEDEYAMMFDCAGAPLRIALAQEVIPAKYTVLGWQVKDIRATVTALKKGGRHFRDFWILQAGRTGDLGRSVGRSGSLV